MRQPLKDLAAICAGQGAPQGDHNYCENGTPFVKAGNLQELLEGKAITSIQKVSDEVAKKHKLRLYPKGTILFAKSGMSCMKGYIYVLPQSAYVVSHLACITPNEDISEYLRYYFNYHKPNQLVKDAAYPSISLSDVGNLVVDMKPESERNEIVSVLQHTESIITLRQQQLQKLNELVKARFVEFFGDMVYNQNGWKMVNLGSVCDVRDGTHDSPKYFSEGYPLVTSKNVTSGRIDFAGCSLICKEDYDKINERSRVDFGDILMPMIGTVGKPVIVDVDVDFAIKNVALIKFYENSMVINFFVRALLQSDYFDHAVISKIRGGTQKFIALSDIRKLEIYLPPMDIQKKFAAFVEQTDKMKAAVQKALDEAQLLFDSLMQKYFG